MTHVLEGTVETAAGSVAYKVYVTRNRRTQDVNGYSCKYSFSHEDRIQEKPLYIPMPASGKLTEADVAAALHKKWDPPAVAGPHAAR